MDVSPTHNGFANARIQDNACVDNENVMQVRHRMNLRRMRGGNWICCGRYLWVAHLEC